MTWDSLTGKTTIVGLIGWPVGHSVSPPMHNAAFAALGLDWRFVPLPVPIEPPERIGEAVRGLRALGLRGACVTVPHKQAVMPFLDEIAPAAQTIGAVNAITVTPDGRLLGDNTDAPGFVADLRSHGVEPAGARVLVLGAGGSARAVVYGLAEAGAHAIAIANRTRPRADALAADLRPHFPNCTITVTGEGDSFASAAAAASLIVNCTSLGMTPQVQTTPWPDGLPFQGGQAVYDLVYNPPKTRLLATAEADGARAIGGLGMLIWQGAIAFQKWTGIEPPVGVMMQAAQAALARRR